MGQRREKGIHITAVAHSVGVPTMYMVLLNLQAVLSWSEQMGAMTTLMYIVKSRVFNGICNIERSDKRQELEFKDVADSQISRTSML